MDDRSGGATALLGMEGFVVLVMEEHEGEWWVLVETTAALVGCPDCGGRAIGHGRSVVQVRDLPVVGSPVRLIWRKRRWRCVDPDCSRRTFTETSEQIEGCLTRRARAEICRRVGQGAEPVARVARDFGVSWWSAMGAVKDHGTPRVDDAHRLYRVRALGVDEHKMLAAGPRRPSVFATQLVELDRGRLLDVVPGRSAKSVGTWLDTRSRYWREHVEVVAIDPHRGYHRALTAGLRRATVTVDHFHVVKLANACVDDVRRRVQRETTGHRGRRHDPLFGARRLMTRGIERLSDRAERRLFEALRWGDPFDEVLDSIATKERLRHVYEADTMTEARARMEEFYAYARGSEVPEVRRLSRTVGRWEREILHFFTTRRTNAASEAQNLVTEKLRRVAHGLRNFEHYRLRLLLHSGVQWDTPPTARIRGRHPRLAA